MAKIAAFSGWPFWWPFHKLLLNKYLYHNTSVPGNARWQRGGNEAIFDVSPHSVLPDRGDLTMCGRRRLLPVSSIILAAVVMTIPFLAGAETPPKPPPLTAAQKERLKERDRYGAETQKLRQAGKLPEAIAAALKMLAIEREVLGNVHEDVAGSLEQI